jgi:hypothetical protein
MSLSDPAYSADHAVHGEAEEGKGHQRHTQDDRQTVLMQRFPPLEPYDGGRDDREADRHHYGGDDNAESVNPTTSRDELLLYVPLYIVMPQISAEDSTTQLSRRHRSLQLFRAPNEETRRDTAAVQGGLLSVAKRPEMSTSPGSPTRS